MKAKLVEAAVASLVERGYAATTAVEVSKRAGVTRGAFNHHYASLANLFADVLDELYDKFAAGRDEESASLESMLDAGLAVYAHPEFKAVLELWLACRNDKALGETLFTKVAACATRFEPESYPHLAAKFDAHPQAAGVYWLIFETMIGLSLARATSSVGQTPAHEKLVSEQLITMARQQDAVMSAQEQNDAVSSKPRSVSNRR